VRWWSMEQVRRRGRFGASLAVLVALAAGVGLSPSPPSSAGAQPDPAGTADCGVRSWVAGTVDLCDGVLVYRDYAYDDWGADTGQVQPRFGPPGPGGLPFGAAGALPPAGDQEYPSEADANTADLVALRLRVEGDRLHVSAELNTLYRPDSTVVALAVDTDDDASTGGGAWPGVAGIRSDGWEVMERFTAGDPTTNRIDGSLPLPSGARWRVQAVTGVAGGPVMNVAFRGPDEYGFWWDERQAALLRAGDVSATGVTVAVADLVGGATRPAPDPGPGLRQRVYTSDHPIPPGEGVSHEGVRGPGGSDTDRFPQLFHFLGRYQPYGVYLPDRPGPHGLQLLMHGMLENHSGRIWFATHGGANMRQQFGDDLNRILVSPLGRGWVGFYTSWSERDVLDVLADVEANYPVDPDRVFAGGLSMGGYGTFYLASVYPDRFAGGVAWLGYTGDCWNGTPLAGQCADNQVPNAMELLGNLRHVPLAMLYAGNDELVWANQAVAANERMKGLGYPYAWYFHPAAGHTIWAFLDEWQKEATWSAGLSLVRRPARVTYRTDRALDFPELGLVHDRAYWVSAIRPRDAGWADVDVTSFGCGVDVPRTEATRGAGEKPAPWVSEGRRVTGSDRLPAANRLEATLANVASFDVDVDGDAACVDAGPLAYRIATDGPTTIHLSDGRELVLTAAGTHEGTLPETTVLAAGATARAGAPGSEQNELPATGGPGTPALGVALVTLALVARRLRLTTALTAEGKSGTR